MLKPTRFRGRLRSTLSDWFPAPASSGALLTEGLWPISTCRKTHVFRQLAVDLKFTIEQALKIREKPCRNAILYGN